MGKKYTLNASGNMVAQRDIYTAGGFIATGSIGAKLAYDGQVSQDGECWVVTGDMSTHPNLTVKGNAFVQEILPIAANPYVEISGDSYLPTNVGFSQEGTCRIFVKDSYIGSEVNAVFGSATVGTNFPFEQGNYDAVTSNRGKTFDAIKTVDAKACRGTVSIIKGVDTKIYVPAGVNVRLLWGYITSSGATYSGEFTDLLTGLNDVKNSMYQYCRVRVIRTNGTDLAVADLQALGVRIIRAVRASAQTIFVCSSESGVYSFDNCKVYKQMSNYSLNIFSSHSLAGWMRNTDFETGIQTNLRIMGKFDKCKVLFNRVGAASDRTAAGRDTFIVAENCSYLNVEESTLQPSVIAAGGVTLRNCILPLGRFIQDPINGNEYENIDFSFACEHAGGTTGSPNFRMYSGRIQGTYVAAVPGHTYPIKSIISYPGNIPTGAAVGEGADPTKISRITGYSYINSGVYLYGDVRLESQPYINRWISENMWERGSFRGNVGNTYQSDKQPEDVGYPRLRTKDTFPARPGDTITCAAGYQIIVAFFNSKGILVSKSAWTTAVAITEGTTAVAVLLKKAATGAEAGDLILPSDVRAAAVKYQSTPRTLRYITNEADRTSPDDTLLGPEAWRNGYITNTAANAGKAYDDVTDGSKDWISGVTAINAQPNLISAVTMTTGWAAVAASFSGNHKLSGTADTNKALYGRSMRKEPQVVITPSDVTAARLVLTYQPCARIVPPYGASALVVRSNGVRLYDNAVLSVPIDNPDTKIVLRGNSVMGELPAGGSQCTCATGDEESVIVKP